MRAAMLAAFAVAGAFGASPVQAGPLADKTDRFDVGARAEMPVGDRVALAAYLGKSDAFDLAVADFAEAYADQNARDHEALAAAVADGRVEAVSGM